jgi:hypothetical protein
MPWFLGDGWDFSGIKILQKGEQMLFRPTQAASLLHRAFP